MAEVSAQDHPMRSPRIEKVMVHLGVGRGGDDLRNAESILEAITGQRSVRANARDTEPEFGIRTGEPIGTKVTLRGTEATEFLETAFDFAEISRTQFDESGNLSFGIAEHTDFPSQEYNPNIGIFGLDVTVVLVRPGYRVKKRDRGATSIPTSHRLTPETAMEFIEDEFGVEVT